MRPGWQTCIDEYRPPAGVVGIVIAQNFPDEKLLKQKLREGLDKLGSKVVWVLRDKSKANHAVRWAMEVFAEYDIEPLVSDTNRKYWGTERASLWRDAEMTTTCERIVVFHDGGGTTGYFVDLEVSRAKIMVVTAKKPKAAPKPRAGRKPVGV